VYGPGKVWSADQFEPLLRAILSTPQNHLFCCNAPLPLILVVDDSITVRRMIALLQREVSWSPASMAYKLGWLRDDASRGVV
jgi:hypothetical protein